LIGLDSDGRIEPFQGLALTPQAFFLYPPCRLSRPQPPPVVLPTIKKLLRRRILRFLPIRKNMSKKYRRPQRTNGS
jgi:hypothetical protein